MRLRRERWWGWFNLAGLAAVSPFLLFPGGWRTAALIILPLLWIGNRVVTGHFIARTPFDVIVLVLLIMVLVSLYATYDLSVSLPKICGVLLGISVFYGIVGFSTTIDRSALVILGVLGIIILFIGSIAVGTNWGQKVPILNQIGELLPSFLKGLPGADNGFHPAEVGGTLTWIIFLPITMALGLNLQQRRWRSVMAALGLVALSVIISGLLLLTQSRSAWIGSAVGACVLLFLLGRWGRIILAIGLITTVVAIAIIGPAQIVQDLNQIPAQDVGTVFNPDLSGREEIWSRAVYGLEDFSFTGMGMGTFRNIVPVLYPLFSISPDQDIGHAHNEFLQAGLDLGILGLSAFSAVQMMAGWLAYRTFWLGKSASVRWLAAGLLSGVIAHNVFGLTDAVALGAKPGLIWWVLLAVIAVLWQSVNKSHMQDLFAVIPAPFSGKTLQGVPMAGIQSETAGHSPTRV